MQKHLKSDITDILKSGMNVNAYDRVIDLSEYSVIISLSFILYDLRLLQSLVVNLISIFVCAC